MNIFDFITLIYNSIHYSKRREEIQLLYREIKSKECRDFISNLVELNNFYDENNYEDYKYNLSESRFEKVENMLFAFVLLSSGLLKLKKGGELPLFIKETFVESEISNSEKDYIYIKKQEHSNINTIYLYIKTKNDKITEIKTDILTEDRDFSIEDIRKITEKVEKNG